LAYAPQSGRIPRRPGLKLLGRNAWENTSKRHLRKKNRAKCLRPRECVLTAGQTITDVLLQRVGDPVISTQFGTTGIDFGSRIQTTVEGGNDDLRNGRAVKAQGGKIQKKRQGSTPSASMSVEKGAEKFGGASDHQQAKTRQDLRGRTAYWVCYRAKRGGRRLAEGGRAAFAMRGSILEVTN